MHGLSSAEAGRRLAAEGPNSLPQSRQAGLWGTVLAVLREPMFVLLMGAAAVYLVLGDLAEALVLAASIGAILVITVVQERRTERALEALRDLSSPRALVVRDGAQARIPGAEVVRGDRLLLREGDRVAADGRVGEAYDLEVDESMLTGESLPVPKAAGAAVASGTLVVRGSGAAEVTATGARAELGRIGASLATLDSGRTSLERETARMVRYIAWIAGALCVLFAAAFVALRGDPLGGILAGLTLAMSLLPEEFPVVLTIFLALGARRIARHGVLTRRLPAVETLGAATVLCCDKTGTLTENRMTLAQAWTGDGWRPPGAAHRELVRAAALACEPTPFDPMERAIVAADGPAAPRPAIERRYPLSGSFLAVAHAYRPAADDARVLMKGAPETVVALCAMDGEARTRALAAAADAASRGMRVLAVAEARAPPAWLDAPQGYPWRFAGLVALADPLRPAAAAAIALCRRAGIRVLMITGDHAATARAIAREAGIDAREVVTGPQLEALDDAALRRCVAGTQVFARVRPEQKLRLVLALRDSGEVVAMTGDGVNDAPALKAAHIGIAMGRRGTDVAREAAALVLLEDDFTSIVGTIRLGRRIYDNIRNAMRYLVAVHVPLAGMAFIPLAAGWPLFLFPVHVVFLEFVIDPACSLVFEAERSDPNVMERPPRPVGERLFTPASLALGVALGAGVLVAAALVLGWAQWAGRAEGEARALAFTALVAGNLALIFANRSHELTLLELATHENAALWWILAGATAALAASIYVPAAAGIFRFAAPGLRDLALAAACGAASVLWYDLYKIRRRRRRS
jgi:Ca2+-transporting ATPase